MIKLSYHRTKQSQFQNRILALKQAQITQELQTQNYNISDQNCQFFINPQICVKNKFIALQMKVKPLIGLYQAIQFMITAFFDYQQSISYNTHGPKLYNDRKIFHPNIDPYTLQIYVPEILNWNPTHKLLYILRRLKYTIIQPNGSTIPNNNLCKKAAYLYKINRQNFRKYIIQYCPAVLQDIIDKQQAAYRSSLNSNSSSTPTSTSSSTTMQAQQQQPKKYKKYIQINQIFPISRIRQNQKIVIDDQFDFLNKRMSSMRLQQPDSELCEDQQDYLYYNYQKCSQNYGQNNQNNNIRNIVTITKTTKNKNQNNNHYYNKPSHNNLSIKVQDTTSSTSQIDPYILNDKNVNGSYMQTQ